MKRVRPAALLAGLIWAATALGDGKKMDKPAVDEKKPPKSASKSALDPIGQPSKFGPGGQAKYAVWFEDGAWHLRTASTKREEFEGSVRIDKGKLTGNFQGLEKAKKLQDADWVFVHADGKGFDFRFVTHGKTDGINFKPSEEATEVKFKLLIGGSEFTGRVLVGKASKHPDKVPFTMPAHPK